jgi:hypothetical protein
LAHLLNSTRFKSPNPAITSFTVTVPATAAGSQLVCIAGGAATITAKLGATAFTKRTQSLSSREVAVQDITDIAGSTTSITISLNGAENVDGMIFEFAAGSLGAFVAGATESGAGGIPNVNNNRNTATGTIATSGATVLFAMFTVADSVANISAGLDQFWGFAPLGKQYANSGITNDPSKTSYWSMIGVSDQPSAGTYQGMTSSILGGSTVQSIVCAYQDLSNGTPTYANPYANAIAAENSLPGTYSSIWLAGPSGATSPNISGYTDSLSYQPGDTVNFKVYSNNAGFTVQITRVGFYNYEAFGGRNVATVTGVPAVQPAPTQNAYGSTECAWSTTATWAVPTTATPGIYSYLLVRTDNPNNIMMGIFVVRSPRPSSKTNSILLVTADTTWQAYNTWGATADSGSGYASYTGRSLYGTAPTMADNLRAFAVSYDRPMGTVGDNAETFFWDSESALVNFLEGNGYDVSYCTMIDLEKDPTLATMYKTVISSGHSEYWSANMRDAFENARDAGTNLMFFSSNTALWHVRFDPADTNKRRMICYKDSHDTPGYDGTTKYDPITFTGTWRDSRTAAGGVDNTVRRPESAMTGQWFIGNGTYADHPAIPDTYKDLPIWRNTRVATNSGIVFRGSTTASITTAGTSITIATPASTQQNDLILIGITYTGDPGGVHPNGLHVAYQQVANRANLTTVMFHLYADNAGVSAYTIGTGNSVTAVTTCIVYGGAVWEDSSTAIAPDTSGSATHSTLSIGNAGSNRWAVCLFADSDHVGTSKTTSWTPGSGLTSRLEIDNSAAGSGPWVSMSIMDTNGAVAQGFHQYSATAQFANPNAAAGIMYISPGTVLFQQSIGAEWDYVKTDEPSTPTNLVMLSRQVVQLNGSRANYYGDSYGGSGILYYGLSLYKAPSGALVFNTGSWRFTWGISRFRSSSAFVNASVDVAMQQATLNILQDIGHSPTTLLGTFANNDPTALVNPGPAALPSNYGLDVPPPTTYQNIFIPSLVPLGSYNGYDGTDYTLGTVFTADAGGKIYGARWYFPDTIPSHPVVATLYSWTNDSTGSALASATFSNCQAGWNQVLFSSPVSITANTRYVMTVWTSDYYASTTTFYTSAVTNGDLTAIKDTTGPPIAHNGKYIAGRGSSAYPTSTFSSSSYFVDVLYIGDGVVSFSGWGISID